MATAASPAPAERVVEAEHLWIKMPDGIRLAARLWLPASAHADPVPALLEYIPYRKGDMTRARDERNHPVFAEAGYACLRVDMRGSGDSEGDMPDMYTPHELDDARHVIEWIAAQPWCDGQVGMFGTSWGGTASLQAAVDPPPALKAIIAVCATHDRYEDDIHHKGGLLLTDSIEWGATLPAILAAPPAADTVGEGWYEQWMQRLQRLTFPLESWVREEERSPYWQWGSIGRQARRVGCPILAIGGWSDRYSNSVMSLVELRPDRVWGIVGPWGHHYPDVGHPGPAIGFQEVALDWWDYWLKGGQEQPPPWPRLRVWLRTFDPPADVIDRRNGEWIALPDRATALTEPLVLHPTDAGLSSQPATGEFAIPWDLRVGMAAGDTGYFGRFGGQPTDQSADDRRSLVFETEPLAEPLTLLGGAEAELEVSSDQPLAQLALRIADVDPSGRSARVALALRNLALEDGFESGRPIEANVLRRVHVRFHHKVYRFAAGHRIRFAISSSYWPLAWPSPRPLALRMNAAACKLTLRIMRRQTDPLPAPFPTPCARPQRFVTLSDGRLRRSMAESEDGTLSAGWHHDFASLHFECTGTTFGFETGAQHSIRPDDPLSAVSRFDHRMRIERPDGTAEVTGWASASATTESFRLAGAVTATWDGRAVFHRQWKPTIPRRLL